MPIWKENNPILRGLTIQQGYQPLATRGMILQVVGELVLITHLEQIFLDTGNDFGNFIGFKFETKYRNDDEITRWAPTSYNWGYNSYK